MEKKCKQVMEQTRDLMNLMNIGNKIAGRLHEVGIYTAMDLREVGSVKAHKLIKQLYPNEPLPVCYYLYSFEGALRNCHWDDIGEERKAELRELIG